MKKQLLTILMITLLAVFSYTDVHAEESITGQETLTQNNDETVVIDTPRIVYYGSEIASNGFYALYTNDSYDYLGLGNLSSTLEEAISTPIVIESDGQSILLLLCHPSDSSKDEEIVLYPGDVKSICFNNQYLYVIVSGKPTEILLNENDVLEQEKPKKESDNASVKEESNETSVKQEKSKPQLLQEYEQPDRGKNWGSFIVSAKGYGVLISGKAYKSDYQLEHPISIDSSGYSITVTYTYPGGVSYTKNFDSGYVGLFHKVYLVIK